MSCPCRPTRRSPRGGRDRWRRSSAPPFRARGRPVLVRTGRRVDNASQAEADKPVSIVRYLRVNQPQQFDRATRALAAGVLVLLDLFAQALGEVRHEPDSHDLVEWQQVI